MEESAKALTNTVRLPRTEVGTVAYKVLSSPVTSRCCAMPFSVWALRVQLLGRIAAIRSRTNAGHLTPSAKCPQTKVG